MKDTKIIFDGEEYTSAQFNIPLPKLFRRTLKDISSDTELCENIFKYPVEMIEDGSNLILKYIHKKSVSDEFFRTAWEMMDFTPNGDLMAPVKKELLQVSHPKGNIHFLRESATDKCKEDSIKRVIVIRCTNFYIEKIDDEKCSFILECNWVDGTNTFMNFYKNRMYTADVVANGVIEDKDDSSLYPVKMREFTFPNIHEIKKG